MTTPKKPELERQTFTTSRELEYFSEAELVTQTGYAKRDWWPCALVKELLDNSLDACEQAGVVPQIRVSLNESELAVTDNGPGIPADVVERITDFSTRTSDKSAYVSPTRGAQGNALKTVLAIPYVLNSDAPTTVEIDASGVSHRITVATDQIARRPHIDHRRTEIVKIRGTSIRLRRHSASSNAEDGDPRSLQKLMYGYSLFNPHATFWLQLTGEELCFPATAADWSKWLPKDPTPAHWYTIERFENLTASYISAEGMGARSRTVRDFVSEFRGLSSTARQKQVIAAAGLDRAYLHDLLGNDRQIDRAALQQLLSSMKQVSAPVKPDALGTLGEAHFRSILASDAEEASFRYKRLAGITEQGTPYIVECAFVVTENPLQCGAHVGLNWSVPLSYPLPGNKFDLGEQRSAWGLSALLTSNRIYVDDDPVCLALHLFCPEFHFLDRGKASVSLPAPFAAAVGKAVLDVTKDWAAIKKKQERDHAQAARMAERYRRAVTVRVTVKQAAYEVLAEAYLKASGDGTYPANARQIMYAARPAIQELTGQALSDSYLTQTLLPDFIIEHPAETADWDVVYDARGHLWEPHTGQEVAVGTLGVRQYLGQMSDGVLDSALSVPDLPRQFPTYGPSNRYGAILYIEKEGFLPLLQQAGFAERYDLAILSSKGMGTTAVRTLIEKLHNNVTILVLHDFDKSGFSIAGTLTRDTRRYRFTSEPKIVDLGLRLADVEDWGLQAEDVIHNGDPGENLRLNGATSEEVEFLRGDRPHSYGSTKFTGRRVELNAFTSDQFVQWLESKLKQHAIAKVIPAGATLERAFRRAAGLRQYNRALRDAFKDVERHSENVKIPRDLSGVVKKTLEQNAALSWDQAVEHLLQPDIADGD